MEKKEEKVKVRCVLRFWRGLEGGCVWVGWVEVGWGWFGVCGRWFEGGGRVLGCKGGLGEWFGLGKVGVGVKVSVVVSSK